jgi:hypothetical protein
MGCLGSAIAPTTTIYESGHHRASSSAAESRGSPSGQTEPVLSISSLPTRLWGETFGMRCGGPPA